MARYTVDISFKCDRCGAQAHYVSEANRVYKTSTFNSEIQHYSEAPEVAHPFYANDDYGFILLCRSCKKEYDNLVDMSKKVQNTMIDSFLSDIEKSDRKD